MSASPDKVLVIQESVSDKPWTWVPTCQEDSPHCDRGLGTKIFGIHKTCVILRQNISLMSRVFWARSSCVTHSTADSHMVVSTDVWRWVLGMKAAQGDKGNLSS
jgi:hypothetical protein